MPSYSRKTHALFRYGSGPLWLLAWSFLLTPMQSIAKDCERSQKISPDLIKPTAGVQTVVFVVNDLTRGTCWHTSPTDITIQHSPWSTFKFPHFLIALDTGAIASAREVLHWDAKKRPAEPYWPEVWRQDQSLKTAFTYSAAWPFQDLVLKVGQANYKKWLARFGYGNAQVPIDRDDFWLGGPLAISPKEQVKFLSCLALSGCGASAASIHELEAVALQGESGGHRMYAKTGSGPIKPRDFSGAFEGWYVGYIKDAEGVATVAFATYVRSDHYAAIRTYRESVSRHLLTALGYWHR